MTDPVRWVENEDWVEFVRREQFALADGGYEALVRFGGPMSRTRYDFYARVMAGYEGHFRLAELEGEEFEPHCSVVDVPGTPDGLVWVHLGHASSERAYRKMTLNTNDGLTGLERICILQVPRRLHTGAVERSIRRELVGDPEPLSGVPLGGVGAGKIEFCRDGLFRNITINGSIDAPIRFSDATFFAVRAEVDGASHSRIVSTEALHGLTPAARLDFEGAYPTAILRISDVGLPVEVEVSARGTIVPRNVHDSSMPLALFTVRIQAPPDRRACCTVVFCVEDFLGCGGGLAPGLTERHTLSEGYYECWEERAGNVERPWSAGGVSGVLFDSGVKTEKRSQGQYMLATDGPAAALLTGWRVDDESDTWVRFAESGRFGKCDDRPSGGERTACAVAVDVDLIPGEAREVRFVFAWHVPEFWQHPHYHYGHFYSNRFACATDVALYGLREFDRLWHESGEVPDLLLGSSLPQWLARSLCNDAFVFSSGTWLTRDGRFAVNEGPTQMFGCMGTMDQKLYANHYYSLFFPDLDRTELLGFARAQATNGGIQHDLGGGHLETKGVDCQWPDLTCALVILSLKHFQLTGDSDYIEEVYPRLVRAILDYHGIMDTDGDGLADGAGVGNTFDAEHFEGLSCYTATLTLAALRALEDLAVRMGDEPTAARCREVFTRARESAVKLLWNGSYFVGYRNTASGAANGNCHVSQLAGEFFSRLCGLGPLYDESLARSAMESMLGLNYPADLAFPTNEATPDAKMPRRQMWGWLPHVRTFLGGLPVYFDMADRGLRVLERMQRALDETNAANSWDLRLFYEPDTGLQHWGRFYMSAPATWLVYQALLGYVWDRPAGVLTLASNVPDNLLPLDAPIFTPGFWARLQIPKDRSEQRLRVIKRFDRDLVVSTLRIPVRPGNPLLTVDGRPADFDHRTADDHEDLICSIDLDAVDDLCVTWWGGS